MAKYFWRTKTGIGSSGAGTEASPFTPKQLADAIIAGTVVSGDVTELMGEFGPVNLADAADFPNHTLAGFTHPVKLSGAGTSIPPANAANSGNYGRNIVFGTTSDGGGVGTESKATGISFMARGGSKATPNVDMRSTARGGGGGAMTNAERQMAALIFQGRDMVVDGFFIRQADHNFAASGRVGNTTATPAGESDRIAECSFENLGLMGRNFWGSTINNCYSHGGDYGTIGILIGYRAYFADPTIDAGKSITCTNLEAESNGVCQVFITTGRQINYSTQFALPNGARIFVDQITAHDAYFYQPGYDNNALRFANLFSMNGPRAMFGNDVMVRRVEAYGDCQDAIVVFGVNVRGEELYARDTCPTWGAGATFNYLTNSGTGWGATTGNVQGVGIKTGLSGYEGTASGGLFGIGTPGGTFLTDQLRVAILYSRVINTKGAGIVSNGSSGMVYYANEVDTAHAGAMLLTNRGAAGWHAVVNNYLRGSSHGLRVEAQNNVAGWNNILRGSSVAAVLTGTGASLYGGRNVLDGSVTGSPTWASNISAVPDYTVGVGPTPGGNCDSAGDWAGLMELRRRAAMYDMTGRLWRAGRLPIGPRQP
jgi:hypothetical protein